MPFQQVNISCPLDDRIACIRVLNLQMEAINVFIDGCKQYGVSEKDLFVTLDLYEKTNPNMVRFVFVAVADIRQYPDIYYILV